MAIKLKFRAENEEKKSNYDREYLSSIEELKIVTKDGLWGVINKEGEEIIPVIYDELSDFENNLILGYKNNSFGILNAKGEEVLPFEYKNLINYKDDFYVGLKNNLSIHLFCPSKKINKYLNLSDYGLSSASTITEIIMESKIAFKRRVIQLDFLATSLSLGTLYLLGDNLDVLQIDCDAFSKAKQYVLENFNAPSIRNAECIAPIKIQFKQELGEFVTAIFDQSYLGAVGFISNNMFTPIVIYYGYSSFERRRLGSKVFLQYSIRDDDSARKRYGLLTIEGERFLPPAYTEIDESNELNLIRVKKPGEDDYTTIDINTGKESKQQPQESVNQIKLILEEGDNYYLFIKSRRVWEKPIKYIASFKRAGSLYIFAQEEEDKEKILVFDGYGRLIKELPYKDLWFKTEVGASRPTSFLRPIDHAQTPQLIFGGDGFIVEGKNHLLGFLDDRLKEVIPTQYESILRYTDDKHKNFIKVSKFGKYGIMDKKGILVIPIIHKNIYRIAYEKGGIFKLQLDLYSGYKVVNINNIYEYGKKVRNQIYMDPSAYSDEVLSSRTQEEKNEWASLHQNIYETQIQKELEEKELEKKLKREQRKQKKYEII